MQWKYKVHLNQLDSRAEESGVLAGNRTLGDTPEIKDVTVRTFWGDITACGLKVILELGKGVIWRHQRQHGH